MKNYKGLKNALIIIKSPRILFKNLSKPND